MTRSLLALVFVLAAQAASAQSVIREVNLSALNLGPVRVQPIDDDGDPETEAWLVSTLFRRDVRLAVVRADGTVCLEDAFVPDPTSWLLSTAGTTVVRVGQRDVLLVQPSFDSPDPMRVLTLDRVRCR
jgi:hypothetical protein